MAEVLRQLPQDALSGKQLANSLATDFSEYELPPGGPIGERLVVQVVDDLARRTPDRIYATVTKSRYDLTDGFRDITIKQLANAVNSSSWFIHDRFGASKTFDVIAYLGVSDVRYAFYTLAAIKTGHVVRFLNLIDFLNLILPRL